MRSKAELRLDIKARLSNISPADLEKASAKVCDIAFIMIPWDEVTTICAYVPIVGSQEIDPRPLLRKLATKKIVFVTPQNNATMPEQMFDLILVPTLGYDERGYRLGRGGGWYDRFLSTQPQAIKVGLALKVAKLPEIPAEEYDIPLTHIFSA